MNIFLGWPYFSLMAFCALLSLLKGGRGYVKPALSKWLPILIIALFGGLRFQTGYDWLPYTTLFERMPDIWKEDLLDIDFSNLPPMEPGYLLLNAFFRILGLSVDSVFLACAIFNVFALSRLLSCMRCNFPLAITFHVGICMILFYFSTVRQGVAVGLVLLACRELIATRRIHVILIYCCASLTFQISAMMYFPILLLAYLKVNLMTRVFTSLVLFVGIPMSYFDLSTTLLDFVTQTFGLVFFDKFEVYLTLQNETSASTWGLLFLNLVSIAYINSQKSLMTETISRLAIYSAMALVIAIVLFPNNSSVWSRMLMFSSSIQGFWYAVHCSISSPQRTLTVAVTCVAVSVTIFAFNLNSNSDFLLPYQTVFDRDYGKVDSKNEILTLRIYQGIP